MGVVIEKTNPPDKRRMDVGDRGSYAMDYEELFALPARSVIRIHELETNTLYSAEAGVWKEYGVVDRKKGMRVLLPIEYFTKTHHV